MQIGSIIAIFFVVWWLTFVAVLPIGNRSQVEVGQVTAGTEPGAPAAPHLLRRVLIATAIAMALTALLLWGLTNETLHHYWNR
jgi:predicted secreted protein